MTKNLKKSLLALTMLLFTAATFTQAKASEFDPYWSVTAQGGVGITHGELSFSDFVTPAAAIYGGYKFTPIFGARVGLGGWVSSGNIVSINETYKFNYVQMNFDATFDVINIFADYKSDRIVNPYVFLGFGVNCAFNNDEAIDLYNNGQEAILNDLWTDSNAFIAGRAGLGIDFRISNTVSLGIEANGNMLADKFNSKDCDNLDWQYNLLAGVTVNFGKKKASSSESAQTSAATQPSTQTQADNSAAVREAEAKARRKAEAEAKRKAEAKAKREAEAEREAAATAPRSIYYDINSDVACDEDVDNIVALMNEYPNRNIKVTGYSDAKTGNSKYNMELSKKRADNLKSALVKKGIAADRIKTEYKGDQEQPYSNHVQNRAVIVVLE